MKKRPDGALFLGQHLAGLNLLVCVVLLPKGWGRK